MGGVPSQIRAHSMGFPHTPTPRYCSRRAIPTENYENASPACCLKALVCAILKTRKSTPEKSPMWSDRHHFPVFLEPDEAGLTETLGERSGKGLELPTKQGMLRRRVV